MLWTLEIYNFPAIKATEFVATETMEKIIRIKARKITISLPVY